MEADPDIGGVCGYMRVKTDRDDDEYGYNYCIKSIKFSYRIDGYEADKIDTISNILSQLFSIQKAQLFEYDIAHIIDKASEAFFGFI